MASHLSSRGTAASTTGAKEFEVWDIISNLWDPNTNPDGYMSLGVAENSLMHEQLRDFFNSKSLVDSAAHGLTYGGGPFGSKRVRTTIAMFLKSHLHPMRELRPEHILVTNGVSAAIEHCAWSLASPGEGVLLGRPYYRAFLPDISMRTGVQVVPVSFGNVDPCGLDCVWKYEEALLRSNQQGVPIRALFLCHPHNPLGRCYPRETIIGLMRLCQKHQIHLISDEIYALSVWENTVDNLSRENVDFESALSIDIEGIIDLSLVHVLWGMSKDFGANGVRLGCIISQSNSTFLSACRTCSIYSSPSSLSENAVVQLLSDTPFVENYIKTNRKRLSLAHAHAVRSLQRHGIEHMPGANAAFFLWINLGKYVFQNSSLGLKDIQQKSESVITQIIYKRLMAKKIYLVSGDAVGAEEPGWFRLVFTQPEDMVEEGIRRISEALRTE